MKSLFKFYQNLFVCQSVQRTPVESVVEDPFFDLLKQSTPLSVTEILDK